MIMCSCKRNVVERLCLKFGDSYSISALSGVVCVDICWSCPPVPFAGVFPLLMLFLCLVFDIVFLFLRNGITAHNKCVLPVDMFLVYQEVISNIFI